MQDVIMILAPAWFIAGQGGAAASDALRMRIPNALILYLLTGVAITGAASQPGWSDLAAHVAIGLAILGGGLFVFARGWMGGGDVKLLAVTGLWLGPSGTPALLVLTALAGGVLTLTMLGLRFCGVNRLTGGRLAALRDPMDRVPYGIAIAAAAIAVAILRPETLVMG
jgi:prepilin peptidase CpaA